MTFRRSSCRELKETRAEGPYMPRACFKVTTSQNVCVKSVRWKAGSTGWFLTAEADSQRLSAMMCPDIYSCSLQQAL